ncbi:MAG: YgaP-like transmembrane domain [Gemmatimonadota bacterium]
MTVNVSNPERLVRGLTGIMLLGLYGALPSPWRYLSLLGLVLLGTALTGNCLLYSLIGRPPVLPKHHTGRGEV